MESSVRSFDELDGASVVSRSQRLRRAWATSGPPDDDVSRPSPWIGLVAGLVIAVLLAGGLGVASVALHGLRPKPDQLVTAGVPPAGIGGPEKAGSPTEITLSPDVASGSGSALAPPSTATPGEAASGASVPSDVTPGVPTPTVAPQGPLAPPPERPTVSALNGAVTVRWPRLPASRSALVDVAVTRADGTGAPVSRRVATSQGGTTFGGLANGVQYRATISTVDDRGVASRASDASDNVTPTTSSPLPPAKVERVNALACNGCLTILWTFAENSGPPTARYRVILAPGGASAEMVWGVNGLTIANLDTRTAYTPSVLAITDAGYGEASQGPATTPKAQGLGKPAAPTGLTVTVGPNGNHRATFTPGDNAGSSTASFNIVAVPRVAGTPVTQTERIDVTPGKSMFWIVHGLKPGTTYTFVVVNNSNGIGISEPSALSASFRA